MDPDAIPFWPVCNAYGCTRYATRLDLFEHDVCDHHWLFGTGTRSPSGILSHVPSRSLLGFEVLADSWENGVRTITELRPLTVSLGGRYS